MEYLLDQAGTGRGNDDRKQQNSLELRRVVEMIDTEQ
jgi:hypothetical protein